MQLEVSYGLKLLLHRTRAVDFQRQADMQGNG